MGISTHILDTTRGRPAAGVEVLLDRREGESYARLATATTNQDGRVPALLPEGVVLQPGLYRLQFQVGAYFAARSVEAFYPSVTIEFSVKNAAEHFHVPLLLQPFGYSTYRGS
ncbi:MAG TPA: hydroxyisourate hydrolase [Pseudomonadota bacterium]|nr:hydroxyisourate hydrolase [Pseudomonadota bacterium]